MTTYYPIAYTVPQYMDENGDPYSGAVLKAYRAGTTTNIVFSTDSAGSTTATSIALNSSGYPAISSNILIPFIAEAFKLMLYPTQAAADANTGAIWSVDNVPILANANAIRYLEYAADTGSADAYVIAPNPGITAYAAGQVVTLNPTNNNTGASTLTVNSLAGKSIKLTDGTDPYKNAMITTGIYTLIYDGTNFVLTNPSKQGDMVAEATIASSTTTDLASGLSHVVLISGTTAITSFGSNALTRDPIYYIRFSGILTLTHNATSLILPGGANITTAAGDTAVVKYEGSGNWRVLEYTRANGKAIVSAANVEDMPAGSVLQIVDGTYSTNEDLATTIPLDDSLPQSGEGNQVISLSITTTTAVSSLYLDFSAMGSIAATAVITAAIFSGNGADASFASCSQGGGVGLPVLVGVKGKFSVSPGTYTFKVRVGANTGTCRLNGSTSGRFFGTSSVARLSITEVKVS